MNVLKLEQREEVIRLIEQQLKDQYDFAKSNIEPVSKYSVFLIFNRRGMKTVDEMTVFSRNLKSLKM